MQMDCHYNYYLCNKIRISILFIGSKSAVDKKVPRTKFFFLSINCYCVVQNNVGEIRTHLMGIEQNKGCLSSSVVQLKEK
jgi:hypothetical protein